MANLKLKKTDLKGPVAIGNGWLITRAFATRVGDDKRLQTVATLNAGFSGLDVAEPNRIQMHFLEKFWKPTSIGSGYQRTRLLVEGEDGVIQRVYRMKDANGPTNICLNEGLLVILGCPPNVERVPGYSNTFTCNAGLIASTTDGPPSWSEEIA